MVGAEIGVTTDAQSSWWGGRGIGTVPHSLIASYGGNTVLAATKFAEWAPDDFNIVVLVDFENDSVRTALEVARALKDQLWGVRLDTSGQLVDRSLWNELGDFDPRGVNERLVRKVRDALDRDGFERVKIVASGGFTVDRIRAFEQASVPVDAYGVGSSLIRGENDFTGDIVLTDGRARPRRPGAASARTRGWARHVSRVLWDVDTQVDFMLPAGSSTCPAPRRRHPSAMQRLVDAAREAGIVHVASADDHELTDPEISDEPDFRNTYPPHCLRGTPGAEKGAETSNGPTRCRSRSCLSRRL